MTAKSKWTLGPGVQITGAECVNGRWLISATGLETARCPDCDLPSACRHGWYIRRLQDLPVQGTALTLQIKLARWQCRNRRCQRRTFADRLPEIAKSFARRTCRAAELARLVGHAAGGRRCRAIDDAPGPPTKRRYDSAKPQAPRGQSRRGRDSAGGGHGLQPELAKHRQRAKEGRRTMHKDMFDRVKILQAAGNGTGAIVRETGFNWRTVAKWTQLGELPERNVMAAKSTTPSNFQHHLSRRWAEGCTTGRDFCYPRSKCLGYTGSLSHLERLLSQWRRAGRPTGFDGPPTKTAVLMDPLTDNLVSPIVAAALCIKPRGLLTKPQAAKVDAFKAASAEFATMRSLAMRFRGYCLAATSRNLTYGFMMRIAPGYTAFAALPALYVKTSRLFVMRSPKSGAMARLKVRSTDSRRLNDPCTAAPVSFCCTLE